MTSLAQSLTFKWSGDVSDKLSFTRPLKIYVICHENTTVNDLTPGSCEGPSGGSRAAAAVADGYREVESPDDWSRSACISATTIPVAELVDTWPPISSGSA